jgi:hypothetical protein
MLNNLLNKLRALVTIKSHKWESISTEISSLTEEPTDMSTNDMIVNSFRSLLRYMATDIAMFEPELQNEKEMRKLFTAARNVRILARDAGCLKALDRAIAADAVTVEVFVDSDFNWSKYSNMIAA